MRLIGTGSRCIRGGREAALLVCRGPGRAPAPASPRRAPSGAAGFTLIELLVVIILMAILTAIAVPRFSDDAAFNEIGFRDELAAAARYAQKRALATGCPVQLSLTLAGFELHQPDGFPPCAANFAAVVVHPATGEPFAGTVPPGIAFTASPALPHTIVFDARGATSLASSVTVQVGTLPVVIHRDSGYVETP